MSNPDIPALIARGFRVFPIKTRSKIPCVKGWPERAASTVEDARLLWAEAKDHVPSFSFDEYNAGISLTGLFVLDFDEPPPAGYERPTTFRVRTGRGEHWYFKAPAEYRSGPLMPGFLDLKTGSGAMVLAPGSTHKSGAVYEIIEDAPFADPPPYWLDMAKKKRGERVKTVLVDYPTDEGEDDPLLGHCSANHLERLGGRGSRNQSLWQVASDLFRDRAEGWISEATLQDLLMQAKNMVIDYDFTEAEALRAIESARDNVFTREPGSQSGAR